MPSEESDDRHVLRILISTDNHLGFQEKDPVRGNDSFAAFEEVLIAAKNKGVDMVLLGGDVFHDNKPSRATLHNTFKLLRTYSLGPEPVRIQSLSRLPAVVAGERGLNYEDPNFSVGLPIFSIHGNHDDPTRDGGSSEALSALDLLSTTNFVNYFGKHDKVDDVCVQPLLLRKGSTKIALYGIGNIRDERLNRMWVNQKVKFVRPTEEEGRDSYINILVLHQNRAEGRGRKNAIYESMIPGWFDVVIWGHEHESIPSFQESLHGQFRILQPGSTVATSLVTGEAQPKHFCLLEVHGEQFRMQNFPLRNVRGFRADELRLDDEDFGLDAEDARIETRIEEVLEERVETLAEEAFRSYEEANSDSPFPPNRLFRIHQPQLVLVRLKVDRQGFSTINSQRFGARFVDRIANPSDILLFHQRRKSAQDRSAGQGGGRRSQARGALSQPIAPDELDEIQVTDLVAQELMAADRKLRLLKEEDLKNALESYVQKQQTSAIADLVQDCLKETQRQMGSSARPAAASSRGVPAATEVATERGRRSSSEVEVLSDVEEPIRAVAPPPQKSARRGRQAAASQPASRPAAKKRGRTGGGTQSRLPTSLDRDSDVEEIDVAAEDADDLFDEDDEIEDQPSPPPRAKRPRASALPKTKKQSQLATTSSTSSSTASASRGRAMPNWGGSGASKPSSRKPRSAT
eukprot:CAMPEP_0118989314 /NCGR_PEP_ID=MMETSP1173-20130426/47786_1 /TAXON_ID=1034831 /ORGANISM="Rhizochromulina marina cf, Strain CCMP1243" /LENGTH=688 /DNA_ID=CAMNT_0006940299 /DNA_START=38 /DNA_END=2101 /DNA_ORIENTATION=+